MNKRYSMKTRRPDLSPREFREYYENNHVPLGMTFIDQFKWRKYIRNYVSSSSGSLVAFDCLTEFWVDEDYNDADLQSFIRSGDFTRLDQDDRRFLDITRRQTFEVKEHVLRDNGRAAEAVAKHMIVWRSGPGGEAFPAASRVLASLGERVHRATLDVAYAENPANAPFDTILTIWSSDEAPLILVESSVPAPRWSAFVIDPVETPSEMLRLDGHPNSSTQPTETFPMASHKGDDLAAKVQKLLDIEEIKRLKYRYFRCFDTADVEGIAEVFHPDVTLSVTGGSYKFKLEGREAYLTMIRDGTHAEMVTQHNGHHPEIDILSPTEARGIWYLHDIVWEFRRNIHINGTAFYNERYLKVDGRWVIKDIEFQRIYEIAGEIIERPNITYSYLAQHARKLPPGDLPPFQKDPD